MPRALLVSFVLLLVACEPEPDAPAPVAPPVATEESAEAAPSGEQLFGRKFAQVCRGSAGQPAAAEYERGTGLHPFVLMLSDDGVDYNTTSVGTFPDGWRATWPDLADAQLVVCAERVSATPARLCEGFEDDDTGATWSVQTHDVVYAYTVRLAQKGDVLGRDTIEVTSERCPMFSTFREGDPDPKPYYPRPRDAEVEVFVRPFVTER